MKDRREEGKVEEEEDTYEKEKEGEEEIEMLNDYDDNDDNENMFSDEDSYFEGEENHNLEKVNFCDIL